MFKIRSVNSTGDSLVVDGRLGGRRCPLTIDSGSTISLIRPDLLQEEPEPLTEGWLRTVTGDRAPVHGWSEMQLGVGTLELSHRMLVADIKDDCILGFDFLKKHGCLVDFKEDMLTIHNQQVPLQRPKQTTTTCCRVTLGDNVDIPPMSETVACGKLLDRPINMMWGVVEPDSISPTKFLDGLLVGRTLVNLSAEEVPVHLLNLTDQPKRIKQGTNVAVCNSVESVLVEEPEHSCEEQTCENHSCVTHPVRSLSDIYSQCQESCEPDEPTSSLCLMAGVEMCSKKTTSLDSTVTAGVDSEKAGVDCMCSKETAGVACTNCQSITSEGLKEISSGVCSSKKLNVLGCVCPSISKKSDSFTVNSCVDNNNFGMTSTKQSLSSAELPHHMRDLYERSATDLTAEEARQLYDLLYEFSDVFSESSHDLGRTDMVKHLINTGGAAPIRQPPRRLPLAKREEAIGAVNEMYKQGVIEPSASPWSSPVVLVKKKDGGVRFCVDYRKLNDVTHKDSYPLPRIDDSVEALSGAKWFSTLDLKSGYWQVELDEKDKEKTAFSIGTGLWQFTVMPFGLSNAPATFERLMEQVLAGLPLNTALIYLDDVLVAGRSFSEQIAHLRVVLLRFRKACLKLNPRKCFLLQKQVRYLGHVVSEKGIATDPEKVEAIRAWPTPTTVKEIRSFVGLCSYYRRFIAGFSDIAQPLLQCAEKTYIWTPEAEEAFQKLKQALTEAPVLGYPKADGDFVVDTDASLTGVGAVLSQMQDGLEKVIAYYSCNLSRAERNYCATRRELLAVIKAVRRFHPYLYGRAFTLRTDHAALSWLLNFRCSEGQTARWLQELQQYNFKVEHRRGVRHNNADALSRRPCLSSDCRHCARLETKEELKREEEEHSEYFSYQTAGTTEIDVHSKTWSHEELREAQMRDADLRPILEWKEEGETRPPWQTAAPHSETTKSYWSQWESLLLQEGVLYRLWETPAGDRSIRQLVLPKDLRAEVLQQLHSSPTAGHLGVNKTLGRVRERFYWVQCSKDVRTFCKNCDMCSSRRGPVRQRRAPLGQYNVGAPMERLAIDVLGPLPITEAGNKYLLITADYFTKWVEAYPIPNQEAITVAEALVNGFVSRFGVPLIIHSDQGRNFESLVFSEMCKLLGIHKTRTTPLHPQSDGMVERFNRTIESQLSKFVDDNQCDWDTHIPLLLMAYRTAVHETTGCTPAQLMMGRDLRLPIDLLIGRPEDEVPQHTSTYAEELQERLERVHNYARTHMKLRSDSMKERYDSASNCEQLDIGDPVWLHCPQRKKGVSPKLARQWQGPYLVTKRINDMVYRVQLRPQTKPKVVHRNRLWKYTGPSPPTWLLETREKTVDDPPGDQHSSENPELPILRRGQRLRRQPDRFGY